MQRAGVKVECRCVPFHISLLLCGVLLPLNSRAQRTPHTVREQNVCECVCSAECLSPHLGAAGKINSGARVVFAERAKSEKRDALGGNRFRLPLAEDKVIVLVP